MAEQKPIRRSSKAPAAPDAGTLHVISDATGGLARHMVTALLTQFPGLTWRQVYHPFQDTPAKVEKTVDRIKRKDTVVLHSLVEPKSKEVLRAACEARGIPQFDLTGPPAQFLATHTGVAPVNDIVRVHQVDDGYLQRIEAMEFTLQHDDSRRLDSIHEADIVLVGLSRVSKTPTSVFLGSLGYRTANVSLAPGTQFPSQLDRCRGRVVALTMQARQLCENRRRRFELNRIDRQLERVRREEFPYLNMRDVVSEVSAAEHQFRKRRFPILDTTSLTIEETAARVLQLLHLLPEPD